MGLFSLGEDPEIQKLADQRSKEQAVVEAATGGLMQMPQTPMQQLVEEDGALKTTGKMMLNVLTGGLLSPLIHPELGNKAAQYKTDLGLYNKQLESQVAQQAAQAERERQRREMMGHITTLQDGVETPEDVASRSWMLSQEGMGTIDKVEYALSGERPGIKPEYQIVDNNGTMLAVDKNNPSAAPIPLQDSNGALRKPMPQHQVDQVGAFDRMVPRLQELDEMEQNGMAIPRSTMTKLRAYETADADGNKILSAMGLQKWMEDTLTPEQRRYILAAEDAGMVVLRDESGAAISASEILRQMNQYLMFDDLDDAAFEGQRNARNRKAQSLTTGLPSWLFDGDDEGAKQRNARREWVRGFDGKRKPKPAQPSVLEQEGLVPSTSAPAPFKPAPQGAVDMLRQNPRLAKDFKAKYGYLPEGY